MLIKLIGTIVKSYYVKPRYQLFDEVHTYATTMPWHIDFNLHVNNAVYLKFLEAARWDHIVLAGAAKQMFAKRCRFIVASIEIGYLREIKLFKKIELRTSILGADEKYLYMRQTIHSDGKLCTSALIKAVYFQGGTIADPRKIFNELGYRDIPELPPEIASWRQLNIDKRTSYSL